MNQGVEFAGRIELARNLTGADAGDRLTLRQVWTFNDFRFRGDRQYGDNRIAGLPPHVLRTTLTYARPEGLFIAPILDWVPQGAWADYANTLRANAYLTLGLEAGLTVAPGVTVFLDARNLTSKRYISDLSTITDARSRRQHRRLLPRRRQEPLCRRTGGVLILAEGRPQRAARSGARGMPLCLLPSAQPSARPAAWPRGSSAIRTNWRMRGHGPLRPLSSEQFRRPELGGRFAAFGQSRVPGLRRPVRLPSDKLWRSASLHGGLRGWPW